MYRGKAFLAALLIISASVCFASAAPKNSYQATILVSNEAGEAPIQDPLLVNAWGIAASPTSPWWVANNGTGTSTLYRGDGAKVPLEVTVPGAPTGMVWYGGSQFVLSDGQPARFMWASEDGTLSGWNNGLGTQAEVVFPESGVGDPGSIYKGLAILKTPIGSGKTADASLILADQLIAAKLNIANGSDPTPITTTIVAADALLCTFGGKLPYNVKPSSTVGHQMTALRFTLDQYNNSLLIPGCGP